MADVMDVQSGVGTGIQPKDSVSPAQPAPSVGAQIASSSLAPGSAATPMAPVQAGQAPPAPAAAAPAPSPAPAPPAQQAGDKDVDDLFAGLADNPQPKAAKDHVDKMHSEVDDLFKDVEPVAAAPKDASAWGKFVDSLPEGTRLAAAKMRAGLGRDPKEQRQAFESMFGVNNIKTVGKDLYFRPDGKGAFTKVSDKAYWGMADFVLSQVLKLPGYAANAGTQVATDISAAPLGPAALFLGGAAGGAMDAATDSAVRGGLNLISASPQDDERKSLTLDILKEAGLSGTASGLFGSLAPIGKQGIQASKGAISKSYAFLKDKLGRGTGEALPEDTLRVSGKEVQKLANIRTAFNEFKDVVFPHATENSPQEAMNAIDVVQKRLQSQIDPIRDEAIALAKTKDQKVAMDTTIDRLQNALQKNGYMLDEHGLASLPEGAPRDISEGSYASTLDRLAKYQNRLVNDKVNGGGTEMKQAFQDLDNLTRQSSFGKDSDKDAVNLFRTIRNAAGTDRNKALASLYEGSGSPNETTWKSAIDEFSQNADAIADLHTAFRTPEERKLMANTLTASSSPEKLALLNNFKQVLGENSKEWNGLRGEIFDQLISDKIKPNGAFNAQGFFDALRSKENKTFYSTLLSKEDQGVLTRMAAESAQVNANNILTAPQANRMRQAAADLIHLLGDKSGVSAIFKITSGNQKIINYLTDEGFMDAYAKAQGPELRQNILNARRLMSGVRDKMTVVDIPTLAEKSSKAAQRYVPIAGAGGGGALDKMLTTYNPAAAPPSPMPAPTPTPNSNAQSASQ